MITCEIMKDLLPAYAAGECSDATRQAVEEHVTTCASCAKSLRAMTEPAVTAEVSREQGAGDSEIPGRLGEMDDPARREELGKEMTFKKGFKKIRRRWLISILCVLLIIPLSGLGYLGYNEARGEGYAFSNLNGLRNVDSFMKSFQKGEYEAIIEYFDIEPMYREVTMDQYYVGTYIYPNDYRLVEIGGAKYYADIMIDRSEFEPYKESGKDAAFWADVIIENADSWKDIAIPAQAFAEAAEIASESLDEEINIIDLISAAPDGPNTYVQYYAQDGSIYYRSTKNGRLSEIDWIYSDYIPEAIFEIYIYDNNKKIEASKETINSYLALGIERYTEMVKEKYITEMKNLSARGMTVESYSIGNPYRRSEDWSPRNPYAEDAEEYWFVDVELLFSTNEPDKFNQIFTFRLDGDQLDVNGFLSMITMKNSDEVSSIISFSISPSPYVLEDDSIDYWIGDDSIFTYTYWLEY